MHKLFKQIIVFTLILTTNAVFSSQNFIQNSNFDKALYLGLRPGFRKSECKISLLTEDLTWNKCLKFEILKYDQDPKGRNRVSAKIYFGSDKDKTMPGFACKPNTTYKFSVELKGTGKMSNIGLRGVEWSGECDFYKDRKKLKGIIVNKPPAEWTRYTGTFKTGPKAKRAAFSISIWGMGNILQEIGDYLLIDKIVVEEETKVINSLIKGNVVPQTQKKNTEKKIAESYNVESSEPVVDGKLDDVVWKKAREYSGFVTVGSGKLAKNATRFRVLFGNTCFYIGVRCSEPNMVGVYASVRENGKNIWKDDCVEIFFDPVSGDRQLTQLVVAAGGGKFMGFGTRNASNKLLNEWDAKVSKGKGKWTIEMKIPYTLLGLKGKPKDSRSIGFNLCRQRLQGKEKYSSWSWAKDGNFHTRKQFGLLVFGSFKKLLSNELKLISTEIAKQPQSKKRKQLISKVKTLEKKLSSPQAFTQFSEFYGTLLQLQSELKNLKLGRRKFAVAMISPTTDPTIPLLPLELLNQPKKISIRAAVNEFKPMSLAIANLTDITDEYRVLIFSKMKNGVEQKGLQGGFPAKKIQMFRAVRVKDSDAATHGQRFDPLVPMDKSCTVYAPPKESALVWTVFDCRDIAPGKYSGIIRVIPQNESAKVKYIPGRPMYPEYQKATFTDIPLELEVLPIELSKDPAKPLYLYRTATNEKIYKFMYEYNVRKFQFSPWRFPYKFNTDGSIIKQDRPTIKERLKKHQEWRKKYNAQNVSYMIGYDCYTTFYDSILKKRFKYGSPEWARAWQDWLRAVNNVMESAGIVLKDRGIEILHEPDSKNLKIMACKLAKEAVPEVELAITLGHKMPTIETLKKLAPYINIWLLYGKYFDCPEYKQFFEKQKSLGKKIYFYYCNVNMRDSLFRYFRRHSWVGLYNQTDVIGMFVFQRYHGRRDWKAAQLGGLTYFAFDEVLPSIRLECLRIGGYDIRYMEKLKKLVAAAKSKNIALELVVKAEKLLQEGPKEVTITFAHDPTAADRVRNKAIELILKLQNEIGM